jgi:hypothetical protein
MKVEIGVRNGSSYVYKGTAEVPVDHEFTDIEKVVMDRIIVYDDGKGLGLDWGRYWRDMHNNTDPTFVLEYIRLPQKRRMKMYTKDSGIKVKVKDVLVSSDRILNKLASVVLLVQNKDMLDDKVIKQLRKEILKGLCDEDRSSML